jgi:hypothetical protein
MFIPLRRKVTIAYCPIIYAYWTLAKIRPFSDGRLCSLSNFRQHHPDPDVNLIFSSGGGRYLFDIESLLDHGLAA